MISDKSLNDQPLGKISILIIESNDIYREMLKKRLDRRGYNVLTAASGHEGLSLLERIRFDLILLSNETADLSGLAILKVIREGYHFTVLPVIMLCRDENNRDIVEALDFGVNDIVTKPVNFPFLFARIRHQLKLVKTQLALKKSNEELIGKSRELEKAAKYKMEFLAAISHELRTPMNGILGMSNLLKQTELSVNQVDLVDTIVLSGNNILNLINDILDSSKFEAGKLKLEYIDFNIYELIEGVATVTAPNAMKNGVPLIFNFNTNIPNQFIGDPNRIRQVLVNLVGNAVKFTQHGHIEIYVTLKESSDKEFDILVEVKDTGVGIPENRVDQIFSPFTQADVSTARKFGGTGLGLSICKNLVELMGGEIGVKSELGEGSNFWFSLTLEKGIPLKSEMDQLKGKKIVYLDPFENAQEIINHYGGIWQAEAICFTNSRSCLDYLSKNEVDCVILEFQLDSMNALDFTKKIDELNLEKRPPTILYSGGDYKLSLEELKEYKFSNEIKKPAQRNVLYTHLVRAILGVEIASAKTELERVQDFFFEKEKEKQINLLIAEDNEINRKVLELMFDKYNMKLTFAHNGREAVDAWSSSEEFDMVLMDCFMPEMDGFEATRAIRKVEKEKNLRHLPILALTANVSIDDQQKCRNAGMDEHLAKPVKEEILLKKILKWGFNYDGDFPEVQADTPDETEETKVDEDIFDDSYINNLKSFENEENQGFVKNLLEIFLNNVDQYLGEIDEYLENKEWEKTKKSAHTYKGAAANLGAIKVAAVCKEIEDLALAEDIDGAKEKLAELKDLSEKSKAYLNKRIKEFSK